MTYESSADPFAKLTRVKVPSTELHIHLNLDDVMRLATDAASKLPEKVEVQKVVVPVGYRCIDCYRDDGKHEPDCPMRESTLPAMEAVADVG